MDVWWNNRFSCKDLVHHSSSNRINHGRFKNGFVSGSRFELFLLGKHPFDSFWRPFMRAIEQVLSRWVSWDFPSDRSDPWNEICCAFFLVRPGMSFGKCMILCGGPAASSTKIVGKTWFLDLEMLKVEVLIYPPPRIQSSQMKIGRLGFPILKMAHSPGSDDCILGWGVVPSWSFVSFVSFRAF